MKHSLLIPFVFLWACSASPQRAPSEQNTKTENPTLQPQNEEGLPNNVDDADELTVVREPQRGTSTRIDLKVECNSIFCGPLVRETHKGVVVAGLYSSGGTIADQPVQHRGGTDLFVAHFFVDGTLDWIKTFGTDKDEWFSDVEVDSNGQIFLYGGGRKAITFDKPPKTDWRGNQIFVAALDKRGDVLWSKSWGNKDSGDDDAGDCGPGEMTILDSGNLALFGSQSYSGIDLDGETIKQPTFFVTVSPSGKVKTRRGFENGLRVTEMVATIDGAVVFGSYHTAASFDGVRVGTMDGDPLLHVAFLISERGKVQWVTELVSEPLRVSAVRHGTQVYATLVEPYQTTPIAHVLSINQKGELYHHQQLSSGRVEGWEKFNVFTISGNDDSLELMGHFSDTLANYKETLLRSSETQAFLLKISGKTPTRLQFRGESDEFVHDATMAKGKLIWSARGKKGYLLRFGEP